MAKEALTPQAGRPRDAAEEARVLAKRAPLAAATDDDAAAAAGRARAEPPSREASAAVFVVVIGDGAAVQSAHCSEATAREACATHGRHGAAVSRVELAP